MGNKKKVYVAVSADIIHKGHINLIKKAAKLGELTVGALTDEAIASYKRYPLMGLEERMEVLSSLQGVSSVIPQTTLDYEQNLRLLKPDYVVHGDDWRSGIQSNIRAKVIATLSEWDGELIEIPYTTGVSIESFRSQIDAGGILPEQRRSRLHDLLKIRLYFRISD